MKIRLDYVSNSSSSSFMLVGQAFDSNEILKAWTRLHPKDANKHSEESDELDDWCDYDLVKSIASELDLNFERGISDYYDMWVLGLPFSSMKDEETKRQFIDRIEESMHRAFPNAKATAIVDGGCDN